MLKDITLGQYFPGNTVIHRMDPRSKILLTVVYIAALFTAVSFVSYAFMLFCLALIVIVSRVRPGVILRGLRPVAIIVIFTAVLQIFYTPGEPIVRWWIFKITLEGIKNAAFMALRIMMLITGSFMLTYTTSPNDMTDGLEKLMNPLKKIKVPVHELAMMMNIALRFIPTLMEEADRIMSAQRARGADFDTGRLTDRAKALLPLLIPLFVSAFRRADELATAMECRCYHGGEGRTRMKIMLWTARDSAGMALGLIVLAGVITLRVFGL